MALKQKTPNKIGNYSLQRREIGLYKLNLYLMFIALSLYLFNPPSVSLAKTYQFSKPDSAAQQVQLDVTGHGSELASNIVDVGAVDVSGLHAVNVNAAFSEPATLTFLGRISTSGVKQESFNNTCSVESSTTTNALHANPVLQDAFSPDASTSNNYTLQDGYHANPDLNSDCAQLTVGTFQAGQSNVAIAKVQQHFGFNVNAAPTQISEYAFNAGANNGAPAAIALPGRSNEDGILPADAASQIALARGATSLVLTAQTVAQVSLNQFEVLRC